MNEDGSFSIRRRRIIDKHSLSHFAYNAKVNFFLEDRRPIFLGLPEAGEPQRFGSLFATAPLLAGPEPARIGRDFFLIYPHIALALSCIWSFAVVMLIFWLSGAIRLLCIISSFGVKVPGDGQGKFK